MVEEGGVEPPYIPTTSKLPGYVARLVVNPDSFYPLKTKLMANIKYFSLKMLIFAPKFMFHLLIYHLWHFTY